jgi:hypothetical protein
VNIIHCYNPLPLSASCPLVNAPRSLTRHAVHSGTNTRTQNKTQRKQRKKRQQNPYFNASRNSALPTVTSSKILIHKKHPVFPEQVKSVEETLFQSTNKFPTYVYISGNRFCLLYTFSRRMDIVCHRIIIIIIILFFFIFCPFDSSATFRLVTQCLNQLCHHVSRCFDLQSHICQSV